MTQVIDPEHILEATEAQKEMRALIEEPIHIIPEYEKEIDSEMSIWNPLSVKWEENVSNQMKQTLIFKSRKQQEMAF